jgi:hypothetical protein
MRSTRFDTPARRRLSRLALPLAAFAAVAGCGDAANENGNVTPNMKEVQEVPGDVQAWPGEAQASCGERLVVTRFNDDVAGRAGVETRALITTPEGYRDYFGHAPPAGVQLGREWVVFYAPGRKGGAGYSPDVGVVGVRGDVLHVVTTLTSPIPPCLPPTPVPGSGGGTGGSTGSGGGPTMTGPANPATGATAPAADVAAPVAPVPPVPPVMRPVSYVLVKFPAQRTRSVDFQHQDINPGCGPGPQPPLCTSSQQCGRGQQCSTERGDCLPCSKDPAVICPAVCFGVCEVRPNPPPPPVNPCAAILCPTGHECVVLETYPPQAKCVPIKPPPERCTSSQMCPKGTRCSTERGDCQGCGAGPGVACPAVCFGVCEPVPGGDVCTGGALMGNCRSAEELKAEAARLCERQMLKLTEFEADNACFAGGFAIARYTCCGGPQPPPPPPPPAQCKADTDCRLVTGGCNQSPCTCSAQPANQRAVAAPCPMTAVACLVDPCANLAPACLNGVCTAQRVMR